MIKIGYILITLVFLTYLGCVEKGQSPEVLLTPEGHECEECHGIEYSNVSPKGSHKAHFNNPTMETCKDCHPSNTKTAHSLIDDKVVLKDSQQIANTNVCDQCHGTGRLKAKTYWYSTAGKWLKSGDYCESCHDGSSIVHNKKAPNTITYFDTTGHGNLEGGWKLKCKKCHNPSAPGHTDTHQGDSRLIMNNDTSSLCLDCHTTDTNYTGILGIPAKYRTTQHSSKVTGNYDYNYECTVCHNPHGSSNFKMINDSINGGLGAGYIKVVFKTLGDLDPSAEPDDGVCDVCHAPNEEHHKNTNDFHGYYTILTCSNCHKHEKSHRNNGEHYIHSK